MASTTSQKTPSFVFEYLPKKVTETPATGELSSSLYDQTSAFLSSFAKALQPTPKLTIEQHQSAQLQQVKAGFESHIATKRKAGIAISASEKEQVLRIERAIQGLAREA